MLIDLLILLNRLVGRTCDIVFAPIAWLPGWLSVTLIGLVTGIVMLWAFKYTSNQVAVKRTRNGIRSNVLALSLFRDELRICLRCQLDIVLGAGLLLLHSLLPMLVMSLPMALLLGQLSLWYQSRPLIVGEEAIVTVQLASMVGTDQTEVEFLPFSAINEVTGPVRVSSKYMMCWKIAAVESGQHKLSIKVAGQTFTKDLAVGSGYMPVSSKRPDRSFADVLMYPREVPFAVDAPVQSIDIGFPGRKSWPCGTDSWVVYWFLISLISAFAAKPFLNVNI